MKFTNLSRKLTQLSLGTVPFAIFCLGIDSPNIQAADTSSIHSLLGNPAMSIPILTVPEQPKKVVQTFQQPRAPQPPNNDLQNMRRRQLERMPELLRWPEEQMNPYFYGNTPPSNNPLDSLFKGSNQQQPISNYCAEYQSQYAEWQAQQQFQNPTSSEPQPLVGCPQ